MDNSNVPLLIIDDFGLKPLRPPEDETFHDLMAERYERAATVLTSNLDFGEWGEAFPANKLLGAATLDRLDREDTGRMAMIEGTGPEVSMRPPFASVSR